MDRAIEVRDLAAQIIDPFGRCDRAGEDGALDLFDVGFEVSDDGGVALDHLVQDRPEHRVSAQCKQFGVLFEPRACAVQLARDTLSNRNDETRSDEDADLAEIDLVLVMVVAGGAQDDQLHPGFVFFDLRAQVKGLGIGVGYEASDPSRKGLATSTLRLRCDTRQQLIDIPVDGEALVQDESGQHVDPLAEGPRLDIEPIVAEERVVQRRLGGRA